MASVSRTAGVAGSITLTTRNTAGQAITPVSVPVVKWYTDAARTAGEVTLSTTGSGSTYTASWTAAQAPATPATRYLHVTIEVSAGVFDTDADDDVSFVDAVAVIGGSTDILTLEEAKPALNIPASDERYDTELAQVVSAASQFVDSIDGPVVKRTVTEEHHGGHYSILLKNYPVASVTSVVEYSNGTATTLTAETLTTAGTYRIDLTNGVLYRRNQWYAASFASSGVAVTYVAGRFDSTAMVDAVYKQAAVAALVHFWQHRGAQSGAATFGGDGAPFGAVPFSTMQLRKQLTAMLTRTPGPAVA